MVFHHQEWDLQIVFSSLQYSGVDMHFQVNDCNFPASLVTELISVLLSGYFNVSGVVCL